MTDMKYNKKDDMEKFICKYKAALNADLSKEEFAYILGVKPDTVRRKRGKVFNYLGLELDQLKNDSSSKIPSIEKIEKYKSYIDNFRDTKDKFNVKNISKSKNKRYVITSAQNATPTHEKFLNSLLSYCNFNNATLLVIPYRYKNPNSIWSTKSKDYDYWDKKLEPYLLDKHLKLNDKIRVMGHVKIQPTAVSPLSGFDSYTGEDSAVFGHPNIELKCIPTPSRKIPKILSTTGAITIPNYTDSKAGHKGEFHHSLAASIIEIDTEDRFFHRHIHADENTGGFYDLGHYYINNQILPHNRAAALVTGDIHAEFHDPKVEEATYNGKNSIMGVLNPEVWVLHDLEDFYSRNHHHKGKDLISYGKHHFGRNNVEKSLQLSADFVDKHSREGMLNLIVKSNHDEALDRWLREADPKTDPENAVFFHYMKYHQYKNLSRTLTGFESIDPFEFWCKNPESERGLSNIDKTMFLKRDESFVVQDVEMGFHGDVGPNGSRGNIKSFSKVGPKLVIGHSHCLTNNHSVLTIDGGWKKISEIEVDDRILSFNNLNHSEYVRVDEVQKFNSGSSPILKIGNNQWTQEVTDYHNLYLKDHSYKSVFDAINENSPNDIPLTSKGLSHSQNILRLEVEDGEIDEVEMIACTCILAHKWINDEGIYFKLNSLTHAKKLMSLFGSDLQCISGMNESNNFNFLLKRNTFSYDLLQRFINLSNINKIPEVLINLDIKNKRKFLDKISYWFQGIHYEDIHHKSEINKLTEFVNFIFFIGTEHKYVSNKENSELISNMAMECGYQTIHRYNSDYDYFFVAWNTREEDRSSDSKWDISFENNINVPVYCLTNRNGNFWVRHDPSGTVSLTGNSPGIYQGVYQVGVSTHLDLEYTSGPSSWLQSHCIIYPDGHRTLIHIIDGKWKL